MDNNIINTKNEKNGSTVGTNASGYTVVENYNFNSSTSTNDYSQNVYNTSSYNANSYNANSYNQNGYYKDSNNVQNPYAQNASYNVYLSRDLNNQNNSYIQNNPYNQGNTYTQSNPYNQGNAYTQSNPYNQGNAYTKQSIYNTNYSYNTNSMYNTNNSYNNDGMNYNKSLYPEMNRERANIKKDKKRIAMAMLSIAIIVLCGFGLGKFGSFLFESIGKENSLEIETRLEGKYNIIVNVGVEADISEEEMDIEMLIDKEDINKALMYLEEVFDRLPEGFIDDVMDGYGDNRYLEINITGKMIRLDDNREVVGLTTFETNKDVIRLDGNPVSWNEYKATVAHELFHVIDFEMDQFNENNMYIRKWKELNPTGFGYSYLSGQKSAYTMAEKYVDNIYFVSEYSKEDVFEDRAEIFSYLISVGEKDNLPKAYQSEHVKNKTILLIDEIEDRFDTASDEDAYWNRWDIN